MTCGRLALAAARAKSSGPRRASHVAATVLAVALQTFGAEGAAAPLYSPALAAITPKHVEFRGEHPAHDVRRVADWALDSGDHEGLPFIIIDKKRARAYVFSRAGALLGAAPVLLGRALGDAFPAGVSEMEMYETSPWQRITPAGRFRAEEFRKARGKWILWVDYESAIALHKVLLTNPLEQRGARIDAGDPDQRRITYGCINVPIGFYDRVIHPTFEHSQGIVYVLPETQPVEAVLAPYEVPRSSTDGGGAAIALAAAAPAVAPLSAAPSGPREPLPSDEPRGAMKLLPAQGRGADEQVDESPDGEA